MMHQHTKSSQLEQQQRELIHVDILKRELLQLFNDYKSSRTGLITFLFRNRDLTREKIQIVDQTIEFIKNFDGFKGDLIEELKLKKIENSEKSRQHSKYHYNLLEKRQICVPYQDQYGQSWNEIRRVVKKGESHNQSGLANLFQDAINIVSKQWPVAIRNTFNKN